MRVWLSLVAQLQKGSLRQRQRRRAQRRTPLRGSSSQRSLLLEPAVAGSLLMCPLQLEFDPERVTAIPSLGPACRSDGLLSGLGCQIRV